MRKVAAYLTLFLLFVWSLPLPALAQTKNAVLIKNGTVMTAIRGTLENTDILIENGKIARIGKGLNAPAGAKVIDATGKYVTPGIIDCHSHTMLDAINEGTYSITSMTQVKDVMVPKDVAIYRALAGGVTSANLLHGSANSIGGQNAVVKFKFGRPASEFLIPDAPPGIKFAMGENPKRSYVTLQPGQTPRYPRTRMGVIETMRDAFLRARDYKQAWDDYKAGKTKIEPRKDLELEPLVEVLEGKRLVHCHGYRADEHLNLMKLADEFGFRIATLQHGLEAYKIAPEIAKRGTGVSIFTDSWSYKLEAYDAIPYNAYLLWKAGVVVSINSDSDERMRRLNLDAAKVEKYGGVPEEEALKMITLNPAKQLGIDKRTGSIEVGKDGDVVIWNTHPFSVYSHPEITMIEGEVYFDRTKDIQVRADLAKEREQLENLDVNKAPTTGGAPPRIPSEKRQAERDEAEYGDGGNQ
ncbi:MAG TPA: amidohydrolase [Pyrinomonadaceae bacterium]|nr:amidohydrolase [Pyrinomonadaceae bacterium]